MENNPVKAHKFKTYQKRKGMSFFAFLFSIVIYISIFYIFSLSPSALFSNTQFWFVISNTLILIIAVDYGAFSSSKDQKPDLYEEYYALRSQARSSTVASSFVSQYPEIAKKSNIPQGDEMISLKDQSTKEENNIIVVAQKEGSDHETPERILEVVKIEPTKADNEACDNHHNQVLDQANNFNNNHKEKIDQPKTIRRSESDKVKRVAFHDEKKESVLKRSETEKHEPISTTAKDDENEFSTMSDEELNRRVEEFIQNFNRQIRLQGARNRQLLEYE